MIDKFTVRRFLFQDVYSMSMSRLFVRLIVLAMKGYFMRATPPKFLRSLISVFEKFSLEITITYTFNIEISRF